jgi:hypothetical protein
MHENAQLNNIVNNIEEGIKMMKKTTFMSIITCQFRLLLILGTKCS